MTLVGLWMRFALVYVGMLVGLALLFRGLGSDSSSGANAGALFGAVIISCHWFVKKNGRVLAGGERARAFYGMFAFDFFFQVLLALVVGWAREVPFTPGAMLFAMAVVLPLHALSIYIAMGMTNRMYLQAMTKAK